MADQRDAYPGINAVTLLEIRGDEDSLAVKERLTPVVRFAVERRLDESQSDYWDHATMLELSVLANDRDGAAKHLSRSLASVREAWEPETTENNLRLIARARQERGEATDWLEQIIAALQAKRGRMA